MTTIKDCMSFALKIQALCPEHMLLERKTEVAELSRIFEATCLLVEDGVTSPEVRQALNKLVDLCEDRIDLFLRDAMTERLNKVLGR